MYTQTKKQQDREVRNNLILAAHNAGVDAPTIGRVFKITDRAVRYVLQSFKNKGSQDETD